MPLQMTGVSRAAPLSLSAKTLSTGHVARVHQEGEKKGETYTTPDVSMVVFAKFDASKQHPKCTKNTAPVMRHSARHQTTIQRCHRVTNKTRAPPDAGWAIIASYIFIVCCVGIHTATQSSPKQDTVRASFLVLVLESLSLPKRSNRLENRHTREGNPSQPERGAEKVNLHPKRFMPESYKSTVSVLELHKKSTTMILLYYSTTKYKYCTTTKVQPFYYTRTVKK